MSQPRMGRASPLALLLMAPALLAQAHDVQHAMNDRPRSVPDLPGAADGATATVRFVVPSARPDRWTIELTGADPSTVAPAARVLTVHALPARGERGSERTDDVSELPPMLGRYEVEGTTVRFVPQFAPVAGVTYVARATGAAGIDDAIGARFTLPTTAASSTTKVAAIYPTSDRVPANVLKLYIEFSAPMSDGEAERRIHLLDARGQDVPRAFLRVDEELWDASRQRLTVLFDPGRIKRGLRANLESGAPLVAGRTFTLVIDREWRDADGRPLVSRVEKRLIVGDADRVSPDARRWELAPPIAGTTTPLVVRFDEPLDRALLERWLAVTDAAGARVPGRITIGANESTWSFVPAQPWGSTPHRVIVDARLEDLAANSLLALFDVDLSRPGVSPRTDHEQPHATLNSPQSMRTTPQPSVPGAPAPSKPSDIIALPFTPLGTPAHGTS